MIPERLVKIRKQMEQDRIDGMILTDISNIYYASGFPGSTATVVITKDRAVIFVDSRYILQATKDCPDYEVKLFAGDVFDSVVAFFVENNIKNVGFEGDSVSFSMFNKLKSMFPADTNFISTSRMIEDIRYVKDAKEIEKIKAAVDISDKAFSYILTYIKPGMIERDVALEIDTYMRKLGAERSSFDTIVAAGPHAAFPHAQAGTDVVTEGQMLKLDFGAFLNKYSSDITRTIFIGEPTDKQREVYNTVLEAQQAAIDAIKPGKLGKEIDAVARDYIKSKGYGEYFGHGLGHSLGIVCHDGPGLTPTSELVLAPGMVMTVEPGIYIEGWGGVRIEEDVVVTETGCEVLTKSPRELIVLK